jgi:hypothetical protein
VDMWKTYEEILVHASAILPGIYILAVKANDAWSRYTLVRQ